jgi:hypothetical protein
MIAEPEAVTREGLLCGNMIAVRGMFKKSVVGLSASLTEGKRRGEGESEGSHGSSKGIRKSECEAEAESASCVWINEQLLGDCREERAYRWG